MHDISLASGTIEPQSVVAHNNSTFCSARLAEDDTRVLGVSGPAIGRFAGALETLPDGTTLFPCTPRNAATLRMQLPWLRPIALGTATSFGFGDRIGLATSGHIQAMRITGAEALIAPIFAQQSVRENSRTGRTPQQVLDDAMWAVFAAGWRAPWGADADHVKQINDLAPFVAAGYTFYTIDPSDHVDNAAQTDSLETLRAKVAELPWGQLHTRYEALHATYCGQPIDVGAFTIDFHETDLLRALVKYGRALVHTAAISQALAAQLGSQPYDIEMSVDETDTPTSIQEHYFIASQLRALNVPVVSLAPRFVGKFQKGVDYIGYVGEFASEFARHAAIMRHFGSYKLSIHTGSDKFSLYPVIAQLSHGRVHVKTAGTSYLEALRLAAKQRPALFRAMLDYAREHFEHDRKTYFLDAQPDRVPDSWAMPDAELPALLEQFDTRQVLHVCFGSILDAFGDDLRAMIAEDEQAYRDGLAHHFARHLQPFL